MTRAAELHHEDAEISLRFAGRSDVGARRPLNEDAVLARFPVFLVADGMGGHAGGDVAAATAIDGFGGLGQQPATVDQVESAIAVVREAVAAASGGTGGTTLSGGVLVDIAGTPHWYVVNIGDSRTYVAWRGRLEQVSVDHSVVQEYVDSGVVTEAEASTHPRRNVITRALGVGDDHRVDSWLIPAERGQRLLVCSDGLSGVVARSDLEAVLFAETSAALAADRLIGLALAAGGPDNVSAVVVDVDHVPCHDGGLETTATPIDSDTAPRGMLA